MARVIHLPLKLRNVSQETNDDASYHAALSENFPEISVKSSCRWQSSSVDSELIGMIMIDHQDYDAPDYEYEDSKIILHLHIGPASMLTKDVPVIPVKNIQKQPAAARWRWWVPRGAWARSGELLLCAGLWWCGLRGQSVLGGGASELLGALHTRRSNRHGSGTGGDDFPAFVDRYGTTTWALGGKG